MAISLADITGKLRAIGVGDGWDVTCPKCGLVTHVRYRIPGPGGVTVDFIGAGGILSTFECQSSTKDKSGKPVPCGYKVENVELTAP